VESLASTVSPALVSLGRSPMPAGAAHDHREDTPIVGHTRASMDGRRRGICGIRQVGSGNKGHANRYPGVDGCSHRRSHDIDHVRTIWSSRGRIPFSQVILRTEGLQAHPACLSRLACADHTAIHTTSHRHGQPSGTPARSSGVASGSLRSHTSWSSCDSAHLHGLSGRRCCSTT
jgi:hypothetical protein